MILVNLMPLKSGCDNVQINKFLFSDETNNQKFQIFHFVQVITKNDLMSILFCNNFLLFFLMKTANQKCQFKKKKEKRNVSFQLPMT